MFKSLSAFLSVCLLLLGVAVAQDVDDVLVSPPVTVSDVKEVGKIEINDEDIERINPENLVDLFRDTPSVNITGGGSANNKIFIHGLDQTNINVTIDGASVGAYGWHHASNSNIDVNFLKSVSVDVGVAPADSGFGSIAGAVRFTTKDARDLLLSGRNMGLMLGSMYNTGTEGVKNTISFYGIQSGFDFLVMYNNNRSNDWENGKNKVQRGTREDEHRGLIKLAYESATGDRIAVSTELSDDEAKRQFKANMQDARGTNRKLIDANQKRTTISVKYTNTNPTAYIDPEIEVYFNDMRQKWGDIADMWIVKTGGKIQNKVAFNKGSVTFGIDFYNTDIENRDKPGVVEKVFGSGLYAQARLKPLSILAVSFGLREDYQSFDAVDKQRFVNNGTSPNISIDLTINDYISIFGGANRVWGGVNSVEHALLDTTTVYKDIKPTTAENYRAGLRLGNEYVTFEGSFFSTLIRNPIDYNNKKNSSRFSGPNLLSKGFDGSLNLVYEALKAGVSYSNTKVKYGNKDASPSLFYKASPVGQLVSTHANYKFESIGLSLGASSEHGFKIDERPDYYVKSYNVYNAFISWNGDYIYPDLTLRADVKNIFNENYYTRSTFAGSLANTLIEPVYEEGRTFVLTAMVKF